MNLKSYSPSINKKLRVQSIRTYKKEKMKTIKFKQHTIRIKNIKNFKKQIKITKSLQNNLLNNLKFQKKLKPELFIPPKQIESNCWFNTMYVSFFFSDKGMKFFRFFRELMITGKKIDGEPIPTDLRNLFFILNLYIESSYNYKDSYKLIIDKNGFKENDTNFFIYEIYNIINKLEKNQYIPNIKEPGNPLYYYLGIIEFLKYNILKIELFDIYIKLSKDEIKQQVINRIQNLLIIPDLIIIQDNQSNTNYTNEFHINKNGELYKWRLDSIIITNKEFYIKKGNKHFTSLLTCNKIPYKFDGYSYSRLSKFNWKPLLEDNIDKDWTFIENNKFYPEKYNIRYGYKILFYYRI